MPTPSANDAGPATAMPCTAAAELLPWMLNGSLAEQEERALREHLATCESCRGELAETAQVWELVNQHVPSLALAEYAQGVQPEGLERERIESHLASCPSCREELELAGGAGGRILEFAAPRQPRRQRRLRQESPTRRRVRRWGAVALAASVAAVVSVAGLRWGFLEPEERADAPTAQVADGGTVTAAIGMGPGAEVVIRPADDDPGRLFQSSFEAGSTQGWASD